LEFLLIQFQFVTNLHNFFFLPLRKDWKNLIRFLKAVFSVTRLAEIFHCQHKITNFWYLSAASSIILKITKSRHLLCGWAKLARAHKWVSEWEWERERERERDSFAVACIIYIYLKTFVCFIKQDCLLAAYAHELCGRYVYANAHSRINSLYHFSLYEHICLSYKTSLLAYNHFQIGGGVMIAFYSWALLNKNNLVYK
jgi:hypothetical protein